MIRAYDDNGNVVDLVDWEKQIRAEVISQLVIKLEVNMPSELDERERYGYTVALTSVLEQLKEQN